MPTDPATGGSREARRRRIVERGSDRLALITGLIQSLPPDQDQSRSSACPPGQAPADVTQHENVTSNSLLPDDKSGSEPSQGLIFDESKTLSSRPASSFGVEAEKSQISDELSQTSSPMQRPAQVRQNEHSHRNSFTAGQISSAITASENIRMCCSVAAAILVIMSYVEFPILGSRIMRSFVMFKPLYMLLLTNISIVLARLILGTQCSDSRMGQTSNVPKFGGNEFVDRMGKALESGLLLQKIAEAMFMDFGIYAVVLVCGLSLVRILGW